MNNINKKNQEIQEYFKKNNYVAIKGFLDPSMAGLLYQYCLAKVVQTDFISQYVKNFYDKEWHGRFGDEQAPNSYSNYGDLLMDTLLAGSKEQLSQYSGVELTPTYSYWRLYQKDEELKRHRDRESCEISVTLCLGYNTSNLEDKSYNWPMWVELPDNPDGAPIFMEPGDMIMYKGTEVDHWRDQFQGLNLAQVFLHYNNINGYFNNHLDGRPILGVPKIFQSTK